MISHAQRRQMRRTIAEGVLDAQKPFMAGHPIEDVVAEVLAALLSLASNIAENNANLSPQQFMMACGEAAKEMRRK